MPRPRLKLLEQWNDWLGDWELALRGRCAPTTVPTYLGRLREFVGYLANRHPEALRMESLTARHVESWMADLMASGQAPATRRAKLMTLRSFVRWVMAEPGSPIATNPTARVVAPVLDERPVQRVSEAQLAAVLKTCKDRTFVDLRDSALIRVLLACGLRREELVQLDLDHFDRENAELRVLGKGGKWRVVSLSGDKVVLALNRYLRVRRQMVDDTTCQSLFVSTRGLRSGHPQRLTGGAVALVLKRRCDLAQIERIKPHSLRHDWAHANKKAGMSDEDLERLGGWSPSSGMVRAYGRSQAHERARDAHRRFGVGDRV